MSGEFLQLPFPAPDDLRLHGLYPTMEHESVTYELLFYVTDDRGIEHYAQMPAVKLIRNGGGIEGLRNSVRLVPGTRNSQKGHNKAMVAK